MAVVRRFPRRRSCGSNDNLPKSPPISPVSLRSQRARRLIDRYQKLALDKPKVAEWLLGFLADFYDRNNC